jgi:FkbM family methyltransferase
VMKQMVGVPEHMAKRTQTRGPAVETLLYIRNRFHPLFHLRRFSLFQRVTRLLDIPVPIRHDLISHPIYMSFSKNLSSVLTGGAAGEEHERKNFVWIVKTGQFQSFIDIGANVGLYGFLFGSVVDGGKVTFVEPDKSNSALIRKTIEKTKLPAVLVEAAASDHVGQLQFHQDNITGATGSVVLGGDKSFVAMYHHRKPTSVTVNATTVDELCNLNIPDFIKIDVEGAELGVLSGAGKVLSQSQPALMFECGDENEKSVREFLLDFGYCFFEMTSLSRTNKLPYNCLALHNHRHSLLISAIEANQPAG